MRGYLTVPQGLGVLEILMTRNNPKNHCNKRLNCESNWISCTSIMFEDLLKFEKMDGFFTRSTQQHCLCEILPELGV